MSARNHVLVAALALACLTPAARGTETPVPRPPEICGVSVRLVGGSAVVEWKGGTPPYLVVRTEREAHEGAFVVVARDVSGTTFTDVGAGRSGARYWYRVYDANAAPEVFGTDPPVPYEGSWITLTGVGFGHDCGFAKVYAPGGRELKTRNCRWTSMEVELPRPALSGDPMIVTRNGSGWSDDNQGFCNEGVLRRPATW